MQKRLIALDGLRGLAALLVVFHHIDIDKRFTSLSGSNQLVYLYNIFAAGPFGVQIFFVLSGFIIAHIYPKVDSKFSFLGKRYARIVPIYLVLVIFFWISKQSWYPGGYWGLVSLLLIAIFGRFSWYAVSKFSQKAKKGLLSAFIGLQFLIPAGYYAFFNSRPDIGFFSCIPPLYTYNKCNSYCHFYTKDIWP